VDNVCSNNRTTTQVYMKEGLMSRLNYGKSGGKPVDNYGIGVWIRVEGKRGHLERWKLFRIRARVFHKVMHREGGERETCLGSVPLPASALERR